MITGVGMELKDNSRYDFKTLKVRPLTYKRLVKLKSFIEGAKGELYSFDSLINHMIDANEKEAG